MIDLKLLEKDFEHISTQLQRKKVSPEAIASLRAKNETLKSAKQAFEGAQAKQNEIHPTVVGPL